MRQGHGKFQKSDATPGCLGLHWELRAEFKICIGVPIFCFEKLLKIPSNFEQGYILTKLACRFDFSGMLLTNVVKERDWGF